MGNIAISTEGLGKKYVIGHKQDESYITLRESIYQSVRELGRRLSHPFRSSSGQPLSGLANTEDFWALRDFSFNVEQGERIGIIGSNGAGKTTLLKLLSRITEPTEGRITIRGRAASLLEVGTGFHPELTGRENIFLNGAILGMSKAEIKRKFDEIVAFAGVEQFLDTPVKRYSSGMYVRLAFSVAAHLEPDILLVDEVLAVGDAVFQKKCLGKMKEVGKEGRTVIFISHNMSAIQSLCERCVVLKDGKTIADESTASAIQLYLSDSSITDNFTRPVKHNDKPTVISGRLRHLINSSAVSIDLDIFSPGPRDNVCLELRLTDGSGFPVGFGSVDTLSSKEPFMLRKGANSVSIRLPVSRLAIGNYFISLYLTRPFFEYFDQLDTCLTLEVDRQPNEDSGRLLHQSLGCGSLEIPLKLSIFDE